MAERIEFRKDDLMYGWMTLEHNRPVKVDPRIAPTGQHMLFTMRIKGSTKSAQETREKILLAKTVGEAQKLFMESAGRIVGSDWTYYAPAMCEKVVRAFVRCHPEYLETLLASSKGKELVYVNMEHENVLGKCYCTKCTKAGENFLGLAWQSLRNSLIASLEVGSIVY